MRSEINSVDKILEKRRKRGGYGDNANMSLTSKLPFDEFIKTENPFACFVANTEITQPSEEMLGLVEPPKFYDEYLADLKVLGRREI